MFTKLLVYLLLGIATSECIDIVSRSSWGAPALSSKVSNTRDNLPYVVIHHSVTRECDSLSTCSTLLQNIRNDHMNNKGYSDIGYNFLISKDGSVYEGRGWNKRGAHEKKVNCKSIGICFLGTFTNSNPSSQAIDAANNLINDAKVLGKIATNYTLIGHRNAKATECPGTKFYDDYVSKMPNFSSATVPNLCN